MKKINLLLASALLLVPMTGCSDAQAKLKDSSTVLISIGNKNITKGDLYSLMNSTAGAQTAVDDANKTITSKEVKVTDDMKTSAQNTLNSYKSMYGDTFTNYLKQNNMTEEEYLNDNLIPSLQAEKLPEKYLQDNWKKAVKKYKPVKATVLEFNAETDAKAALSELTDGSKTAAEAASGHNSSSTGDSQVYTIESTDLDSMVRTVLSSQKPDDGWKEVPSSDGGTFYLVHVDDNDADNFKDDAITALSSVTAVSNDSTEYFFRKYKFHVYDKTIYDAMASSYPYNLVQDADAAKAAASASADSTSTEN